MPKYTPQTIQTCSEGWKTPANGTYVRPDGTTFRVPLKTYNGICGSYSSYGGYTQAELHKFSENARKNGK